MPTRPRAMHLVLAALIFSCAAIPTVHATASAAQAPKPSIKSTLRQIKALQQTTAALLAEVTALQTKAAELEAREPAVNAAPTGPAGGDFSGTYPNPKLRPDIITSSSVLNGTLEGTDFAPGSIDPSRILDGTIGSTDLGPGAIAHPDLTTSIIGGSKLAQAHVVKGPKNLIGPNANGGVAASCPANERLLGGGVEWELFVTIPPGPTPTGLIITASNPNPADPNQWVGEGRSNSDPLHTLRAYALCLGAG